MNSSVGHPKSVPTKNWPTLNPESSTGHLFLVRHGENEDNVEGILNGHRDRPLTERGREQARIVGEKLKGEDIQVAYSSPLSRALETAEIIAGIIGIAEVTTHPDLIERDFGVMTGRPIASILDLPAEEVLRTDGVNYFLIAEGSEDFPTLIMRAGKILTVIRAEHPSENTLVVTHGDIGKMIRAAYHGWDWRTGLETPYFDNTGVLELRHQGDVPVKVDPGTQHI
jgi:broad specificity phosphatase PhoE